MAYHRNSERVSEPLSRAGGPYSVSSALQEEEGHPRPLLDNAQRSRGVHEPPAQDGPGSSRKISTVAHQASANR